MTDLVSRLLEAIAAKEENARAAIAEASSRDNPEGVAEWVADESGGLYYEGTNNCFATGTYGGDVPRAARALIVDNDPSSVLRRCSADRKIVTRHSPAILHAGGGADYFKTTRVCTSCEPKRQFPETSYPCPTILALAEAYGLEMTE